MVFAVKTPKRANAAMVAWFEQTLLKPASAAVR
jgi:hypothetical protein